MDDTMIDAQVSEDIETQEVVETPTTDTVEVAPQEPVKISDLVADKPQPRMVDEHIFVAEKKARKELERKVRELEARNAAPSEYSSFDEEIAEEFNVDPAFTRKLLEEAEKRALGKFESKTQAEQSQKEIMQKFDQAITNEFNKAVENAPEFAGIANMDVIKTLALLPANQDKTILNLLEETYGNAITGKRTIEKTTPGGGKDPEPFDYDRATKDIEYFNKVMEDPKLRDKYNQIMLNS